MLVYFIPTLLLYIFAVINPKSKILKKFLFILLAIFLSTTYFNGSDWRQYEKMYSLVTLKNLQEFYAEKGFYIYMWIFKKLNFDFFEFFIFTKMIILVIFYKIIIKSKNFYLTLNLFYSLIGIYLFIDCPLRNLMSIGLVLIGIENLNKKKQIKFYFYVLVAVFFHTSAVFFLITPIIYKIYKLSRKNIIIMLLIAFFLLISQEVLLDLLKYLPFFKERLEVYIGTKDGRNILFSFGNLEKIIVISLLVFYKNKLKYYRNEVSLAIVYFLLYRVALTFTILTRVSLYLYIFYIFCIDLILRFQKNNIRNIVITLFFVYSLILNYKLIKSTYKYLPYTSYLKYLGKEKPNFLYRDRFNKIKYYERTGKILKEIEKEN